MAGRINFWGGFLTVTDDFFITRLLFWTLNIPAGGGGGGGGGGGAAGKQTNAGGGTDNCTNRGGGWSQESPNLRIFESSTSFWRDLILPAYSSSVFSNLLTRVSRCDVVSFSIAFWLPNFVTELKSFTKIWLIDWGIHLMQLTMHCKKAHFVTTESDLLILVPFDILARVWNFLTFFWNFLFHFLLEMRCDGLPIFKFNYRTGWQASSVHFLLMDNNCESQKFPIWVLNSS